MTAPISEFTPVRNIRPLTFEARLRLELLKRERYETYRQFPLLWAQEVMGESPQNFKWSLHGGRYSAHTWDGTKDPLSTAWESLAKKQWVGVAAATGTSKTYWLARAMLWYLDCFEDALVVTTAPKESQLTLNLWGEVSKILPQFKKTRPNTRVTKLRIQPEGENPNNKYFDTHHAIGFVAGVGADEESATKAQGFHRSNMLIICEEAAGMNGAVMTAFTNTCTGSNNLILAVGNPDSETDELYKFCQLSNVHAVRISAYDFPNVVLKKEIYHGAVSEVSIERRLAQYKDPKSPMFLSRVRGITPSNSNNSLIKGASVDECDRYHPNFKGQRHFDKDGNLLPIGYNAVGVDVANSETGDMACLAWGRAQMLTEVQEFQCPNANHLAYNIVLSNEEIFEKGYLNYETSKLSDYDIVHKCIGVDTVGVGVATFNTLYDLGIEGTALSGGAWTDEGIIPCDAEGKYLYTFQQLRSQMLFQLSQDILLGEIVIDIPNRAEMAEIKKELTTVQYMLSSGSVAIEQKANIEKRIGKSPNKLDAIAYWNWVRRAYRLSIGGLPIGFG